MFCFASGLYARLLGVKLVAPEAVYVNPQQEQPEKDADFERIRKRVDTSPQTADKG